MKNIYLQHHNTLHIENIFSSFMDKSLTTELMLSFDLAKQRRFEFKHKIWLMDWLIAWMIN